MIKKYTICARGNTSIAESPFGNWCKAADVVELLKENERLQADNIAQAYDNLRREHGLLTAELKALKDK